ncbi:hypothetical protein AB833_08345 [Chromatiales bacterium (ex Bugula neritina AB1)]|nr:hypothetical protein AB833_08345 [Chromatiales bacterium (ex Bugula neritina AB1)]
MKNSNANRRTSYSMYGAILLGLCLVGSAARAVDSASASSASESAYQAQAGEFVINVGHAVTGIAVVPAVGHYGSAMLAAVHPDMGARLFKADGTELWRDDTPAKLVGFYQGTMIIYRDHEETTRLDTYAITPHGAVSFRSTAAPSPVAATAIQRTAYSLVGPVRLDGNKVVMNDSTIELGEPVSAFAAAKRFIPLVGGNTHFFALESGVVVIRKAN